MTATAWWRDDDAGPDHPRLARLLELAVATGRPVAVAAVPTWLEPAAVARIRDCPLATVLQHGIGHADYAPPGDKYLELGGTADRGWLRAAIVDGRKRLEDAFAERFLAVMVPPWNRIDDDVTAMLPELGFFGLSRFAGQVLAGPPRRVDSHLDGIDWDETRQPKPRAELVAAFTAGLAEGPDPFGLLTHHRVVHDAGWDDLDHLLRLGHDGAAVHWAAAAEVFDRAGGVVP